MRDASAGEENGASVIYSGTGRKYHDLARIECIPWVLLVLDGSMYESIRSGQQNFHRIATSQSVSLCSQARSSSETVIHLYWIKADIFALGKLTMNLTESEIMDQYNTTSGSVCGFYRPNEALIQKIYMRIPSYVLWAQTEMSIESDARS